MSSVFENNILCPFCELDILEPVTEKFYRDPGRSKFDFDCPRCRKKVDIEVIHVPVFQSSVPVGRLFVSQEEKLYCIVCDAWVLKSSLKRWSGDDALHWLCPGCDSDLVQVEPLPSEYYKRESEE
jgi:hypothetical protein